MPEYYIGLMSGTSLDGVDAVLAAGRGGRLQLLDSAHLSYPSRLRERLLALHRSGNDELNRAALLANELSDVYASAVRRLLARAGVRARAVTAIGCHGQTVRHRPRAGYTTQLVDGARLAERTGIAVVCDFRSRDIAAEGEGAPLAPAYHHAVFGAARRSRAIVNVGGIANITRLPARGAVTGFDCGPGNCLLDAWVREKRRKPFDAHGAWAARGRVIPQLLKKLLAHPFFRRRPPKSTGRDDFELRWVRRFLSGRERAADVQATLTELTAASIALAVRAHCRSAREIFVCGGGARNRALIGRLGALLPDRRIATTAALGVEPEHVEALAFAWLARQALKRRPGNLPSVTGAKGPRVLGAIYPR
ncbi:MAG: anhydro-N-acetylmuramic acid kinase [Betaproteobacteria bacterium RIFCSPLOWO2_02_FULL_67_26]|nr:MAG: anhydro-N-acetylmuramic acid kinase [Betaproteobacteria bacterium RIFCSPLOWO2_02_FULL_67_26]